MPGTSVIHAPSTMVVPSVQSGAILPDRQGASGYIPQAAVPASTPAQISAPLNFLIPSSLSTSSASLSTTTMFATQLLSQNDRGSAPLLAVYEELVAASQVKYKPSMAAQPQPASNNLFAKMLAEEKSHTMQPARETMAQVAQQSAAPTPRAPQPKARSAETASVPPASGLRQASHMYQSTVVRNKAMLDNDAPVEAISG